jgi:hypothetical protein
MTHQGMLQLSKRKNRKNKAHTPHGVFLVFAWQGHNLTLGGCRTARDMDLGACT